MLCGGLYASGGTRVSEGMRPTYTAMGRPGLEAAWCARCWRAWVQAVRG